MNSSPSRSHLGTVITLAYLLECLEAGTAQASAHGYRQLVLRLQDALADDIAADALQAIINAYPATGEVFENLHYARAGLCRSTLALSVSSELAARQVIARAAARSARRV